MSTRTPESAKDRRKATATSYLRIDPECGPKCRSTLDAARLISIAAMPDVSEEELLCFLSSGGVCSQPGKVSDSLGRTLLHVAASVGKARIVEWLLRFRDAEMNAKDHESGYSALHRSLLYGQVHVAEQLLRARANPSLCDHDGLTPFDIAQRDTRRVCSLDLSTSNPCEAFVWGANSNYNLGLGHQQQRLQPDTIDAFRKETVFCRRVELQKFHSAFILWDGRVFTCGHGRGGRLGLDNEESHLTPRPVTALKEQTCVQVALGVDHSVFLTSSGGVWTCGTNTYHQLGIVPPPPKLLTPQHVQNTFRGKSTPSPASSKLPAAVGIAASRFHSLFWTKSAVYTWGLNAGQLGHIKGERTIASPKLVTTLQQRDTAIKSVVCSEGAVIVLTEAGDVIAMHNYQTRRITTKQHYIAKVVVLGGQLDPKVDLADKGTDGASGFKLVEGGGKELKVFLLSEQGKVSVWEESRGSQVIHCTFTLSRELLVADLAVSRSNVLLLSKEGTVYEGVHQSRHEKRTTSPPSKLQSSRKDGQTSLSKYLETNPCDVIRVKRVPGVFRGTAVACDPKGRNFCVLQLLPNASLYDVPEVEASSMAADLKSFYNETCEEDSLCDVVFVVGHRRFAAHRFVVASSSERLARQMSGLTPADRELVLDDDIQPEVFEQILKYAYTKTCDLLVPGPCQVRLSKPTRAKNTPKVEPDRTQHSESISAFAAYQNNKQKGKFKPKVESNNNEDTSPANIFQALHRTCRELGVHGLVKALECFNFANDTLMLKDKGKVPRGQQFFSRKSFPEFHDVVIKTEDEGEDIAAHRCVLAARLEYFRSMFSVGWLETRQGQSLTLPIPSKVAHVIFEYLYRDEAAAVAASDDIDFVCNVLVVADQLLITRLIQLCERQLAQLLSLKNAADLMQFAVDFGAAQLKRSAMQFASQNLATLLENRAFAGAKEETLAELTAYYQQNVLMSRSKFAPIPCETSHEDISDHFARMRLSTMEEILAQEEAQAASLVALRAQQGASRRRRRTDSGEKPMRPRKSSVSSVASSNSDSGSERGAAERPEDDDDDHLSLDEFEFEEKLVISTTPGSTEISRHDPWTTSHNEHPKQAGGSVKKFGKKSQKDRKREAEDLKLQETLKQVPEIKKPSDKPQWQGWGATTSAPIVAAASSVNAAPSLAEIMKVQSRVGATPSTPVPVQPKQKEQRSAGKTAWRQLSFTEPEVTVTAASAQSPKPANPWTRGLAGTSPAASAAFSPGSPHEAAFAFEAIVHDESKRRDQLRLAASKPLAVTQLEERAIEELERFYNVHNVFDENITVERVEKGPIATPIWNWHRK